MVAYAQAAGVPIAVPESWSQWESAKQNMLFSITIFRTSRKSSVGKFSGRVSMFSIMKALMEASPVGVSMFVYIDFASAEKSLASFGSVNCFRSFITSKEFLM